MTDATDEIPTKPVDRIAMDPRPVTGQPFARLRRTNGGAFEPDGCYARRRANQPLEPRGTSPHRLKGPSVERQKNEIDMNQSTKALDDFSRKERARNIRAALICFVFIVVILLAGFLFSVGEIKQVQGTTKGLYGHPGDQGESMFLLVTLDDGKDVKVSLPDKVPFIKESRVIATETTTRLFGIRRYSFLQYEGCKGVRATHFTD